ncbi:hypothetical protein DFH09DRAFT_1306727 [Mycena vulgaris]|nr:hypothetical protein DFH09DRAFT_1306727 [Mycena vulgaris]
MSYTPLSDGTPRSFCWKTQFPEAGLSATLLAFYEHTYPTDASRAKPKPVMLLATIMAVRELFHHFGVPEAQVDARFEAMAMRPIWNEICRHTDPAAILEFVPIRDPADTRRVLDGNERNMVLIWLYSSPMEFF